MFNNSNNPTGKNPDNNDMTNRSNNYFIANNPLNINNDPNVINPYEPINDKSNLSNIADLNQNSNFKSLELENINSKKVSNFSENKDKIPGQPLEYSQISNLDSSRFTNIPLNDLNMNNNMAPLANTFSEKPGMPKINTSNLTNNLTSNTNNAINNNFNKLNTNITGIPSATIIPQADFPKKGLTAEDKQKDHLIEKKNKKVAFCYYIFHLLLLILFLPAISLVYMAKKNVNLSELSYFAEIFSNWDTSPINEISLDCDKNQPLINDWWPGISDGCFCYERISPGSCPRRSNCKTIQRIAPLKYKLWKANHLCVERMEYGYFDKTLAKSANDCPQNMQNCGIADTQGNFLCVDKNKKCPINKIVKIDSNYKPSSSDIELRLSDTTLILGRDGINLQIPVQFKIAFDQPCLNPFFENLNFDVYRLNYFYGKQRCYMYADSSELSTAVFDLSYSVIDSYNAESLYAENGIKTAVSALPQFNPIEYQRPISLYAKSFFGLKINCFQKIKNNPDSVFDIERDSIRIRYLDDLSTSFIACLVIQFIVMIMMIILICGFRGTINPKKKIRPVRVNSSHLCCYCILFVIMALCYFIFIGVNASSASNLQLTDTFHSVFETTDCVDEFTIDLYDRFIPSIDKAKKYLKSSSLLMGFVLLSQLVFFIFSFWKISKTDFYDDEE